MDFLTLLTHCSWLVSWLFFTLLGVQSPSTNSVKFLFQVRDTYVMWFAQTPSMHHSGNLLCWQIQQVTEGGYWPSATVYKAQDIIFSAKVPPSSSGFPSAVYLSVGLGVSVSIHLPTPSISRCLLIASCFLPPSLALFLCHGSLDHATSKQRTGRLT